MVERLRSCAPTLGGVEDVLAECVDSKRAERFRELVPVPGLVASDYAPRVIRLCNHRTFIADLRFRDLDPSKPLVQLRAASFELIPTNIAAVMSAVVSEYAHVRPRWFRAFLTPGEEALAGWEALPTSRGLRVMAEHLSRLKARPLPARYDSMVLRRRPNSELGWDGFVDGSRVGAITLDRTRCFARRGFEIVDQWVAPHYRGRGLGAALQRAAIERLRGNVIVFGTISPDNVPSLRTARRIGRLDIGGFHRFDVSGRPRKVLRRTSMDSPDEGRIVVLEGAHPWASELREHVQKPVGMRPLAIIALEQKGRDRAPVPAAVESEPWRGLDDIVRRCLSPDPEPASRPRARSPTPSPRSSARPPPRARPSRR